MHEFEHDVKLDVEARVRQGVKAVLEEVLEEEMAEHLQAGYRELTPTRRGERNGYFRRNLVTPAGKIERLEVPRDREGEFVTELFEFRHWREIYPSGRSFYTPDRSPVQPAASSYPILHRTSLLPQQVRRQEDPRRVLGEIEGRDGSGSPKRRPGRSGSGDDAALPRLLVAAPRH